MLQVWLEKLRCKPFHEVGIAYVSFVLGMKPSLVQYFGLSRTNALYALMLLFSQLVRIKKVALGSSLHIADRRECCTHLSIFVSSYTGWQIEKPVNLVANAL